MIPYITVNDAQAYFDDRLNSDAWDDATDDDKLKALKTATRLINNLRFIGKKAVPGQENEFPRSGQADVPIAIQEATCELALLLLDQIDSNMEVDNTNVTSETLGGVKTTYARDFTMAHVRNGIPSSEAWAKLLPYLTDPLAVKIGRLSTPLSSYYYW